ncbi:MAG TPA: MBL fold metallo-hydrolase [Methanomicrobiales archaeon]|nr:MBL fold metallo-hydrolase [Methanomicrobiales archaeon]
MELRFLGTGDAVGTPKVGCDCETCRYAREAGIQRLRTSLLIEEGGRHLLIDTSPDLRQQLLCAGSPGIDAVIWTHGHYDHYSGYGEFYRVQDPPPVYAADETLSYCAPLFAFLPFEGHRVEPFLPFEFSGLTVTLFPVNHPPVPTFGVRIDSPGGSVAYTGDTTSDIPERSRRLLSGVDLLILDAIVPPEIRLNKHMNYEDALRMAGEAHPGEYRLVHLSHLIPWTLPHLARDGECILFT